MATTLIIGIDFGMTFTGVAYNTKSTLTPRAPPTQILKKYPGRIGKVEDKVPTVLTYSTAPLTPHNAPPLAWGFLATDDKTRDAAGKHTVEWFKLFLDPKVLELIASAGEGPGGGEVPPITMADAKRWYTDYLRALYAHIRAHMLRTQKREVWESGRVEFLFSVPTTWTRQEVVENYREVIRAAGFGGEGDGHSVEIGLTEAEAAAVWTGKEGLWEYRRGDTVVVCDAGGGTTDLAVLTVASPPGQTTILNQLDTVHGASVGSTLIDTAFHRLVTTRLSLLPPSLRPTGFDPEAAATLMTRGEFQYLKTAFGAPDTRGLEYFVVEVPGLGRGVEVGGAGVAEGGMRFSQADIKALFDTQLNRIYELLDKQLTRMARKYPDTQINYLVLSGGLGSSPYIQEGLRARYEKPSAIDSGAEQPRHPNALNMEILMADEPQLAVAKGLVIDRIQKLTLGKSVMGEKCCRANFGIVCKELYNPALHQGMEVERDKHDRKVYALQQVDWFVLKDSPVSEDRPIEHTFKRKIPRLEGTKDYLRIPWTSAIVTSDAEPDALPKSLTSPNITPLCNLRTDLTHLPLTHPSFKKKNRRFFNSGPAYYSVNYAVKCVIGSADLRFEVWMDGVKYSEDGVVGVEYFPAGKGVFELAGS